jgi:hypothetical protein
VVGACERGDEPLGSIKHGNFLTSCKPVSFSGRTLLHGVSKYYDHIDRGIFVVPVIGIYKDVSLEALVKTV